MVEFQEGGVALISVSDKEGTKPEEGIVPLARGIVEHGFPNILSSGGTAAALREADVPVIDVSDYTEWEEMLGGRVKTLHPKVHGGILADTTKTDHMTTLERLGIPVIGLVCVDMYPLAATVAKPDATRTKIIESTDIGGPTMLAGAGKADRIVLSRAEQRPVTLNWLMNGRPNDEAFRAELMMAAFEELTDYYVPLRDYLGSTGLTGRLPRLEELAAPV